MRAGKVAERLNGTTSHDFVDGYVTHLGAALSGAGVDPVKSLNASLAAVAGIRRSRSLRDPWAADHLLVSSEEALRMLARDRDEGLWQRRYADLPGTFVRAGLSRQG